LEFKPRGISFMANPVKDTSLRRLDPVDYGRSGMSERLTEIAKRIESQPWNRPGTDKTWVLNAMSTQRMFQKEVRQAKRVRSR
jgi:hypothetical protein